MSVLLVNSRETIIGRSQFYKTSNPCKGENNGIIPSLLKKHDYMTLDCEQTITN